MCIRTSAILCALVALCSYSAVTLCDAAPVVDKLRALLNSNPQLKASVAYTLRTVPSESQWIAAGHGRDLGALYDFFDAWAVAVVVPSDHSAASSAVVQPLGAGEVSRTNAWSELPTATTFSLPMWSLAFSTGNAVWVRDPSLLSWLSEFFRARGTFMDSAASWTAQVAAKWWARVNRTEYIVPAGGFGAFNGFFTRQIDRDYRPVDPSEASIVAPADGYVWLESSNVTAGSDFQLKTDTMDPARLLGYNPVYERYVHGGTAIINFLAATNYHHFWSPVSGKIVAAEQLAGLYVGVENACCVGDHRRAYVVIDTGDAHLGIVSVIMVGYYDISSIVFNSSTVVVGQSVSKGDELGKFQYGGSEIITLFEPGRITLDHDVVTGWPWNVQRKVGERYAVQK